jgi:hypothetical protein
LCVELKKLPDEVRAMSSTDFIHLVAALTKDSSKPKQLDWDQGGEAVVLGFFEQLRKRHNG